MVLVQVKITDNLIVARFNLRSSSQLEQGSDDSALNPPSSLSYDLSEALKVDNYPKGCEGDVKRSSLVRRTQKENLGHIVPGTSYDKHEIDIFLIHRVPKCQSFS